MNNPLVSVIIPTYNRPVWLAQAIASVLSQTYLNCELIVVDDGSDDPDVKTIVKGYKQVKYYFQVNSGLGNARNKGLDISRGEFIQFLDDDDWLDSCAIECKMEAFRKELDCGVSYSDLFLVDKTGCLLGKYYDGRTRPLPSGFIFSEICRRNFIPIHAMLFRKEDLVRVQGFPNRSGAEDWECLVKISEFSSFSPIDEPLGYYRLHKESMTLKSDQQISGEAETQKYILSCNSFRLTPRKKRVKIITGFAWQQWRDGDPIFGKKLLSDGIKTEGIWPRFIILKILLFLGRSFSRWLMSIIFKIRRQIKYYSKADKFFTSKAIVKHTSKLKN